MHPEVARFRKVIFRHFKHHARDFPWRPPSLKLRKDKTADPYKIFISEIMLQQTQALRVVPFYLAFIARFPNFNSLARASEREVLRLWQGLGYNRRALWLLRASRIIVTKYDGKLPKDVALLTKLPGVGKGTAGALVAFAFNIPSVFIETNIRRVFLHHFFSRKKNVSDNELFPFIEIALNKKNPRVWYYALMDYGAWLAKEKKYPNRRAKEYKKQSAFKGSWRELRGKALKLLLARPKITDQELSCFLKKPIREVKKVQEELKKEGFCV